MHIGGIQKLTLLDYPEKIACTVFFSGCNLRCPYCHNASLVLPERAGESGISEEELLAFLKTRVNKLDGVCVTGGEPTLQKDLPELLSEIKGLGFLVKLDTNGTNPELLSYLIRHGLLDYVAMDLKNSKRRYRETCGGRDILSAVEESVNILLSDRVDYEFRTTVCKPLHSEEEMVSVGRWIQGAKRYYLQPFVDSGDLVAGGVAPFTQDELEKLKKSVLPYVPNTKIRG